MIWSTLCYSVMPIPGSSCCFSSDNKKVDIFQTPLTKIDFAKILFSRHQTFGITFDFKDTEKYTLVKTAGVHYPNEPVSRP